MLKLMQADNGDSDTTLGEDDPCVEEGRPQFEPLEPETPELEDVLKGKVTRVTVITTRSRFKDGLKVSETREEKIYDVDFDKTFRRTRSPSTPAHQ